MKTTKRKFFTVIAAILILTGCTAATQEPSHPTEVSSETAVTTAAAVTSAETTVRELPEPDITDASFSEAKSLIRSYFGGYIMKNSEESRITAEDTVHMDVSEEGGTLTAFTDSDGALLRYRLIAHGGIKRTEMNYYIIDESCAYFTELTEYYDAYSLRTDIGVMRYDFKEYWLCDGKISLIDNMGEKLIECAESPVPQTITELVKKSENTAAEILSENTVLFGEKKIRVNVVMTSGEKKHIDLGYYNADVYEGDFSLVSYSDSGKLLERLEIDRFYPEQKNFFPAEKVPLSLYDYGTDGKYEFPICRYETHNYSLCKLYSVDENGHFSSACNTDRPISVCNPKQNISLELNKKSDISFSVKLNMTPDYAFVDNDAADKWFKTHENINFVEETYVMGDNGHFIFEKSVSVQ